MNIVIADDEPLARKRLRSQLQDLDPGCAIFEAANGIEVIELVTKGNPDLVLLDIQMPGMDGLEAARHLSLLEHPPAIIFTTAYDEYALEAFETQAMDYILKPVIKERLAKALQRCSRITRIQLDALQQPQEKNRTHLSASISGKLILIPITQICYLLAEHKYVTVNYQDEKGEHETIIEETLKALEDEFTSRFFRIHRNALVQPSKVEALRKENDGRHVLVVKGCSKTLEVSRRHLGDVKKMLKHL